MKLEDYAEQIKGKTCRWCGEELPNEPEDIEYYPHSGGWTVDGFKEKLWLYVTCIKCKYQWALWKIGVPRE